MIGKAPLHGEDDSRDGVYMAVVRRAVHYPITALVLTLALLVAASVRLCEIRRWRRVLPQCRAGLRPALCPRPRQPFAGRDGPARRSDAEERMLGWPGIKSVYTRVGKTRGGGSDIPEDVVGVIKYEFIDWRERKSAHTDPRRAARASWPAFRASMSKCACPTPARRPARRSRCSCRRPIRPGLNEYAAEVAARGRQGPGRHRPVGRPAAARRRLGARGRPLQGGAVRRLARLRSAPSCSSSPPA